MAVKKRVFQVAREFNISNEALIEYLKGLKFDIRNHMSPITEDAYAKVADKFGEQPVKHDPEYEFRKRLRDKQTQEQEKTVKAREELERRIQFAKELAEEKPKRTPHAEEKGLEKVERKPVEQPSEADSKPKEKIELPDEKPQEKKKRPKKRMKVVEIPPESPKTRRDSPDKKSEKPATSDEEKEGAKTTGDAATDKGKPGTKKDDEKPSKRKRRKGKTREEGETASTEDKAKDTKRRKGKKKKRHRPVFNEEEIQESIRQTLASMEDSGKGKRKKRRSDAAEEEAVEETQVIRVSEFMSLAELANRMDVDTSELIRKCMDLGMMVTINQRLDMDTITLLAEEYGFEIEALSEFGEDVLEQLDAEEEDETNAVTRPPVVTIMGHVDHGKTSLLDRIRESNIIAGESGGITQHIGAYEVLFNDKAITFLDTPGHEAFTAMRARGAQATDIVVLVVAADDNVMPQTIEAISHAKAANVPIVVAINKIDKPNANPETIRQQLSQHDVLVEQWGGKYQSVEISAKSGQNIDQLLDLILLEAELLDLKAVADRKARGVVIESRLDKGKGVVATVLVQAGTLRVSDPFIAGSYSGKVRNLLDERSKRTKEAGPSVPVQVLGFDGVPQAGDSFVVLESERDTKEISQKRQQLQREHEHWRSRPRTLDEISRQIQQGQVQQLSVVLKADMDGSVEAITDSLQKLATDEVAVNVIHRGVGAITESDVLLASASGAIIIGFHVRPSVNARDLADREQVDIRSYNVIYDIIEDIKSALEGFLAPTVREVNVGTVEVRQTFKVPKIGIIAGSYVLSGRIKRSDQVKLYRDDRLIHEGKISSLKRFKDDAKEVAAGFECGVSLERYNDLKVNDIIELYEIVEEKRTL